MEVVMGSIYIIRNKVNNKVYIGQTTQRIGVRWSQHLYKSKFNTLKIHVAMRELGKENFYYEVLENDVSVEKLGDREKEYIILYDSIKNGYNKEIGGYGGLDLPLGKIKEMYLNGMTLKQIGIEFGCDRDAISLRLSSMGIEIRDWNASQRINITENDLRELYITKFLTTPEIAEMYHTSHQTILKYLNKYGIEKRKAVNRKYLVPKI
jgi:hypothetical protein